MTTSKSDHIMSVVSCLGKPLFADRWIGKTFWGNGKSEKLLDLFHVDDHAHYISDHSLAVFYPTESDSKKVMFKSNRLFLCGYCFSLLYFCLNLYVIIISGEL